MTLVSNRNGKSRRRAILDVMEAFGGAMPIRKLAQLCIDEGLYSDADKADVLIKAVMSDCRQALRERDDRGLPVAGPTRRTLDGDEDDSAEVWIQRVFWEYDDYAHNILERVTGIEADSRVVMGLHRECVDRYGQGPELPPWLCD